MSGAWTRGSMQVQEVDYHEVFKVSAVATALLTPDLVIIDANEEFLDAVGRWLDEVVGQYVFRRFPKMPDDPANPKWTALEAALLSGEREVLRLSRYDFEDPARPGVFEERYWSSVVTPVYRDDGELKLLELSGREVTSLITSSVTCCPARDTRCRVIEARTGQNGS